MALGEPSLWANVYLMEDKEEIQMGPATLAYLRGSGNHPLFLTWFSFGWTRAAEVFEKLISPHAGRLQRITMININHYHEKPIWEFLMNVMGPLSFPILQDVEIYSADRRPSPSWSTLHLEAPCLRRSKLETPFILQSTSPSLVVLDQNIPTRTEGPFDLNPLLDLMDHVSHSLEHLRIGGGSYNVFVSTPDRSKIYFQKLKSLIIGDCDILMHHILTPNLTHLDVCFSCSSEQVVEMFNGFSAPKLKSIRFYCVPLLPLLASHNIPSMFPQLTTIVINKCDDTPAFISLLEPLERKESVLPQEGLEYQEKPQQVENPFPELKELEIRAEIDLEMILTSLQVAIEKRLEAGINRLQTIRLGEEIVEDANTFKRYLTGQGIRLTELEWWDRTPGLSPPLAFQDYFYYKEHNIRYFFSI